MTKQAEAIAWMQDLDRRYRQAAGLQVKSYKIFYSRVEPAPMLVLGINPGGNPARFHEDVAAFYPSSWVARILANDFWFEQGEHEYVDCGYPIARVMAKFLGDVTGRDADGIRRIPKTNLVFRRSPGVDDFEAVHGMNLDSAERESRPFVDEILSRVQPQVVLLEGLKSLDLFLSAHTDGTAADVMPPVMAEYRGRSVRFCVAQAMRVRTLNRPVCVIAVGHPSSMGHLPGFTQAAAAARRVYALATSAPPSSGTVVEASRAIPPAEGHPVSKEPPVVANPPSVSSSKSRRSAPVPPQDQPAAEVLRLLHGCEVHIRPAGKMNQLEIWRDGVLMGEYERSNDREVDRKVGEIRSALRLLIGIYDRHGRFEVRWDGKSRSKVIRVNGVEVGTVGKEHWGRPGWER